MSEITTEAEEPIPTPPLRTRPSEQHAIPETESSDTSEAATLPLRTALTPGPTPALSVRSCDDPDELQRYFEVWQDLADNALEENVFYRPWMLLPAIREFGAERNWKVLLVIADNESELKLPTLYGLFPLVYDRRFKKIPLGIYSLWHHPYCFLHTPLVRLGCADACFQVVHRWLAQAQPKVHLFHLNHIRGDGPFQQAFQTWATTNDLTPFENDYYQRALLVPGTNAEDYLTATLSHNNLRQLRRQRRRLCEKGNLELQVLQPEEDLQPWLDDFLRLEAAGWKGQQGTAFANREQERNYFQDIMRAAHENNSLMMLRLVLDGITLACKCNFLGTEGSYAFKITYDESYFRFSPGAQLELDNIRRVHEQPQIRWMDSCAEPQHFMINRLWGQRRTIRSVLLPTRGLTGKMILKLIPTARWLKQKIQRLIPQRKTKP